MKDVQKDISSKGNNNVVIKKKESLFIHIMELDIC